MTRLILAFVIGFTLMWGVLGTLQSARGQETSDVPCPLDKPFKRFAVRYPITLTCTLLACSPRLKCLADSDRCYSVVEDCNKCFPQPVEEQICLSQEELDKAR